MLKLSFPDLYSFYKEAEIIENTSPSVSQIKDYFDRNYYCMDYFQMPLIDILNSKYSYKKGLEQLDSLNLDWNIGGTKKKIRWAEDDGDELSPDRLYNQLPYLQQRTKKIGEGNGKFVDIYINMDISAGFKTERMLYRAYSCVRICDWLEENGYKVAITVYDSYSNPGTFRGKSIDKVLIEVKIKDYSEPLNKGMLLSASSPWMLRYHFFRFIYAKFNHSRINMGFISKGKTSKTSINIERQCFDEKSLNNYIVEIKQALEIEEDI